MRQLLVTNHHACLVGLSAGRVLVVCVFAPLAGPTHHHA